MKTVVLFYSRTQKTAIVAKTIAEVIQADILEVMDLKDRGGFLNYMGASADALRENKTNIKPDPIEISDYGLVYIGTPTWAGKPAPAIITLIDKCDLKGKDVILFATMGSRGGRRVLERMEEKVEARGGRMVNSFLMKTGNKSMEEISEDTKKVIQELDLKLYEI